MTLQELLSKLQEIQARLILNLPKRLRPYFDALDLSARGLLVLGPRGVGKTTLTLSRSKEMLYIPADNPLVAPFKLWDICEAAFRAGYDGVIIDELHYAREWAVHLKALYDAFPGKRIWATDSSSALLESGVSDLSRRFVQIKVPLLSFREFIAIKHDHLLPVIAPYNPDMPSVQGV